MFYYDATQLTLGTKKENSLQILAVFPWVARELRSIQNTKYKAYSSTNFDIVSVDSTYEINIEFLF